MIRVGMQGDKYALIMAVVEYSELAPNKVLPLLTAAQAADLYAQLKQLLPEELLNVEPFSSDEWNGGAA